ncbi:MAG TPA: hypothetical protein DEB31_04440 [Clostridiales bacterium]|nr:hypothetical protein [Clostridiales bacterium]
MLKPVVKKSILAAALAVVLAVLIEFGAVSSNPRAVSFQFDGQAVSASVPPSEVEYERYTVEQGVFTPSGEDPQLYVPLFESGAAPYTASLRIAFSAPLSAGMKAQVFYPDKNGGYSEGNSRSTVAQAGQSEIVLQLPAGSYDELRIDLDGTFALDAVEVSEEGVFAIYTENTWNAMRFFCVLLSLFVVILLLLQFRVFGRIKNGFTTIGEKAKANPRRARRVTLVTAVVILLLCLAVFAGLRILGRQPLPAYFVFTAFFGFSVCMFAFFFRQTGKKPEYFFLIVFLPIALFIAMFSHTTQALISWDDETHFAKMQGISYVGEEAKLTNADLGFIARSYPWTFDAAQQNEIYARMEEDYTAGAVASDSDNGMQVGKLAYVPGAAALFFGRIFGLSYHAMLVLARIPQLLIYALCCFFAIRKLKTGKMILAVVALLPTTVFMSANFSYDPWIIGFLLLGFSWFFGEAQRPDKTLAARDWAIMLGAFALGLAPKAIYFPMVALLLFLPKTKFASRRAHIIYLLTVLGVMLAMAGTMFLSQGSSVITGPGDIRGGSDVNAAGQVGHILSNPLDFAGMMARFLPLYLDPFNQRMFITSFAYLGDGVLHMVLIALMAVVAFTDRNEFDRFTTTWQHKARTLLLALITVVCVAGAMYITFTPVGADTVNGCQARYMTPVVFPVLYVLGWKFKKFKWNRNLYNTTVFSVSAFMLYLNAGYMILGRYFLNN